MVGLIVISHGDFAKGLLSASRMIMGEQDGVKAIGLQPEEGPEDLKETLKKAIENVDHGQGVLILADLFGGTPSNTAAYLLDDNVEVITGFNLPMFLELINSKNNQNLSELVETAKNITGQGVKVLSEVLSNSN